MKSVGQDMDQEAADEFVGVEGHQLVAVVGLGPVILPFQRHALAYLSRYTHRVAIANSRLVAFDGAP